jgi:molybdopterin/thiamine biosynthesis adenylyltransferase
MKTVTIVGVGALGSHVAQFLRSTGVNLKVIDFDRVEQKNVLSQFHGKPSVGKAKVESLKQAMNFFFGTKIETIPHKLTSDNEKQLLSGADLIVDCLDNGAARRLVQAFARRTNTPCIHGGLAADGTFGLVRWDHDFTIDDEPGAGAATCENGEHLPFIALTSAYLARAVQEFFLKGRKIGYNVAPYGTTLHL